MLDSYHKNGFAFVQNAIPKNCLTAVNAVLHFSLLKNGPSFLESEKLTLDELIALREQQDHKIVYDSQISIGSSLPAYQLLVNSSIIPIAAEISGAPIEHLHAMPMHVAIQNPQDESYDYTWHQESTPHPWCQDILSFWFPLTRRSDVSNGTMSVIPGSHLLGKLPYKSYKSTKGLPQYETEVTPEQDRSSVAFELDPGDLAVFSAHLIHRSVVNRGTAPRITGIIRIVNMSTQKRSRPLYKSLPYEE